MIALIIGNVASRQGDEITVVTESGLGYEIAVPLTVLEGLPPTGSPVTLHVVTVVREDSWSLYGFSKETDRHVFKRLLNASGVGPRLALALMSALGSERVVRAVRDGDLAALCTVSGVGKKKAERMVLELKDRIDDLAATERTGEGGPVAEQAITALTNLGYPYADAATAVRSAIASDGNSDTPVLIRAALQALSKTP